MDSLKTTCILKKRKMLSSPLRERLAFLNPDILLHITEGLPNIFDFP